jgi:hypothetical protein
MGGSGSGSWWRWNTQTTCEEVKRVDIRYMKKHNLLKAGHSGTLSWKRGDEDSGYIGYRVEENRLILDYRFREHGGEWQPIKESVWFDRTPCNYGGERLWFLCPHCSKRVAVLYGVGARFLCRHCYDIHYSSQMKGKLDQLIEQKHKLGYRIFEDYDGYGWRKKKGMHQKTFDRLHLKYQWLKIRIDEETIMRFGMHFDL